MSDFDLTAVRAERDRLRIALAEVQTHSAKLNEQNEQLHQHLAWKARNIELLEEENAYLRATRDEAVAERDEALAAATDLADSNEHWYAMQKRLAIELDVAKTDANELSDLVDELREQARKMYARTIELVTELAEAQQQERVKPVKRAGWFTCGGSCCGT